MNTESVSNSKHQVWETCKSPALSPESHLFVRVANVDDFEAMVELENEAWDDQQGAPASVIEKRLRANPGCTIIAFAEDSELAVGFFTFVGTSEELVSDLRTWEYYAELANRPWGSSEVHYGVSLTVSRKARRGTGTCIMQAAREYSKWLGAKRIIAVTRAPSFHLVQEFMSFDQYYNRLLSGETKEPLYFLFCSAGWKLVGYCSNYYADPESCDFGLRFEA